MWPVEVPEIHIEDMVMKSDAGNKILFMMLDEASKFLLAFPRPAKGVLRVARNLLAVMLTFGLSFYVRRDPVYEFTAEAVQPSV